MASGDYDEVRNRLRAAVAAARPQHRAALEAILQSAHDQATGTLAGGPAPPEHSVFAGAWAMLHDTPPLHGKLLPAAGALKPYVDPQGAIWGLGKYEQLDPGWAEALIEFLKYRNNIAPPGTAPQVIQIPDVTTIAIAGDWGTGSYAAPGTRADGVANQITAWAPDYTLHLGDVYYAGAPAEEQTNFLTRWPEGKKGSFTLNSNHEMYAGAHGYFGIALTSKTFALQHGTAYFALVNKNWLVLGLDSAYGADPDELYMKGRLDQAQSGWLATIAGQYEAGRKIIVTSHHEAVLLEEGATKQVATTPLWDQVTAAVGRPPDYWYFGHAHNAVTYAPYKGCHCRCVGHGGIPYGVAIAFQGAADVTWYEKKLAGDSTLPIRVMNGFVHVSLAGATITEKLIRENGEVV